MYFVGIIYYMPINDEIKTEIINKILLLLYNDGAHMEGHLNAIFNKVGVSLTRLECVALVNKLKLDDLLEFDSIGYITEKDFEEKPVGYFYKAKLTENSKKIIDKNGTYTNYIKSITKKEKSTRINERLERILKYVTGIIAVFATVSTLILSIRASTEKQERSLLEQDKKQLTKERDSLIQAANNFQTQQTKELIDTTKKIIK